MKEAELDKHLRHPAAHTPYKLLPLALGTYGRHGREAPQHVRLLERA